MKAIRQELLEQLQLIQEKKQKALQTQSFELAATLKDFEKEILKQLESLNKTKEQQSKYMCCSVIFSTSTLNNFFHKTICSIRYFVNLKY